VLAFIDDKGLPRRLDLRAGEVRTASKEKLASLTTLNGSDIYGITAKGGLARITPAGDWSFDPPARATSVFPQSNGSVVIAGNENGKTSLWLIQPTDEEVVQVASLPLVSRIHAQVGDRIYFAVDTGLVGVRTRDLTPVKSVRFKNQVEAIVSTPSGDRMYVALKGANSLSVVDRYSESVSESVELPGSVTELRMDPLGQYILARPEATADSVWVIGIGTDRVNGSIATDWRPDIPAFAPGSSIAVARGNDVVLVDASTLATKSTITNGAQDFWYFLAWNGFRPRAAELDRPVTFDGPDSIVRNDSTAVPARTDSVPSPPLRDAKPSMLPLPPELTPVQHGYMVSFAAVLSEQKATETAAGIVVNGVKPRVVQSQTGSTTLFRVVMGPYTTREEADRVGRDSKRQYWVYEETR
jgi:cell division septation protein DedD